MNMSHAQQKVILRTLRSEPFNLTHLPKDPRTVLNTPSVVVRNIARTSAGGRCIHFGFSNLIKDKLGLIQSHKILEFIYIFNTDGGQVFKTDSLQFWPIQFRMFNVLPKRTMVARIFVIESKPSNCFEIFKQFVGDIQTILEKGGIDFQDRRIPIHIRSFIADGPARTFALNHYSHTSIHAYLKCLVERHGQLGRTVFPGTEHVPKTDERYRNLAYDEHQKGPSPLSAINGLVIGVPFECLHLIYLGVVIKLLHALVEGKYARSRLSSRSINVLDARRKIPQDYCSSNFSTEFENSEMLENLRETLALSLFRLYIYIYIYI